MRRYRARGWTCAESAWHVAIGTVFDSARAAFLVSLETELPAQEIRFTRDGSEPSPSSEKFREPFLVGTTTTIRAAAFENGRLIGHAAEREIRIHKAFGKPVALATPYEKYSGGGPRALTDGMRGTTYFNDGFWQGYHQVDLDATVDLGAPTDFSRVQVGFLETIPSWIFLPTAMTISVSDDGRSFRTLKEDEYPVPKVSHAPKIVTWGTETRARARYVRVQARNVGLCPPWHAGKGDKAWLFVDEIIVE
jgi:hexosaminidase